MDDDTSNVNKLVSFAWQISNGLQYLASLGHIHRDIAARNILLDKNNVCKVSDFGLCRTVDNQLYMSRGGKLPVRWMAIESLKAFEYSTKTDV
jgi:proto-oncogene tyrosine-protein kinase Ret